jgi:hypothetical protein
VASRSPEPPYPWNGVGPAHRVQAWFLRVYEIRSRVELLLHVVWDQLPLSLTDKRIRPGSSCPHIATRARQPCLAMTPAGPTGRDSRTRCQRLRCIPSVSLADARFDCLADLETPPLVTSLPAPRPWYRQVSPAQPLCCPHSSVRKGKAARKRPKGSSCTHTSCVLARHCCCTGRCHYTPGPPGKPRPPLTRPANGTTDSPSLPRMPLPPHWHLDSGPSPL